MMGEMQTMKNVLVYCNTYYQLLVAIQLRLTIKNEDQVSIILTDESLGAEEVATRLKETGFFYGAFFLKTKVTKNEVDIAYKLRVFRDGVFGNLPVDMPRDYVCDELIGYNLDLATHGVYAALYRRNEKIRCNSMEEGLLSYDKPQDNNGLMRSILFCRSLLGRKNLRRSVKQFYCFNPEAYQGDLEAVAIPRLDCRNATLRSFLQQVFLGDRELEPYRQKDIYLPCIYDMEGGEPIGEVSLAGTLVQHVGKANLLVKVHPRDDVEKYKSIGAVVDINSQVPFEVLCILQDISDKILITTLSGSVLNVSAMLAEPPQCWYAYPLCDLSHNFLAQHFCGVIRKYLYPENRLKLSNIHVLEDLSQLTV